MSYLPFLVIGPIVWIAVRTESKRTVSACFWGMFGVVAGCILGEQCLEADEGLRKLCVLTAIYGVPALLWLYVLESRK